MQRQRGELVPIGEALGDLDVPVKTIRGTSPLGGTVKLSRILGFWRRNRLSVERRINNLGSGQGAD